MRTTCMVIAVALSLFLPSRSISAEPPIALVLTRANHPDSETQLVTLRDSEEVARQVLGQVGVFTRTDSRLYLLIERPNGFVLRCWNLGDGKEIPVAELRPLVVRPILNVSGFSEGLRLDGQSSTLLYMGARTDWVDDVGDASGNPATDKPDAEKRATEKPVTEKKPATEKAPTEKSTSDKKNKKQKQILKTSFVIGGLSLETGESFEVSTPGEVRLSLPLRSFGERVGCFVDGNRFMLFDAANRRFDPESVVPELLPRRHYFEGLGVFDLDEEYRYSRYTDEKLRRLNPPQPLFGGENLRDAGFRIRREPGGTLVAVTFVYHNPPPSCVLSWRDPITGKESYRRDFSFGYPFMAVSDNGMLCLLDNNREKRAILFDRSDERVTEIDYSRYELPILIVGLSAK